MRENGNYWVKFEGKWYVAYYNASLWFIALWAIPEFDTYFRDEAFDEIDEKRIERTEPNFVVGNDFRKITFGTDFYNNADNTKSDAFINQFAC